MLKKYISSGNKATLNVELINSLIFSTYIEKVTPSKIPNKVADVPIMIPTKKNILIDLSADFRLKSAKEYLKWYKIKHNSKNNIKNSIYALAEITKKKLKNFKMLGKK